MIEYMNGEMSDIMDMRKAIDTFASVDAKYLHIGKRQDLFKLRADRTIENRLSEIEDRIAKLENPDSQFILLPTKQEIKIYA